MINSTRFWGMDVFNKSDLELNLSMSPNLSGSAGLSLYLVLFAFQGNIMCCLIQIRYEV